MESIAIGVDVGATKIAAAVVTPSGQVLAARQMETRVEQGVDSVIARIVSEIQALAAQRTEGLSGVGIGVPGLVNPGEGIVIHAVNMSWHNVPLRAPVAAQLGAHVPVYVENDVRSAARGEALFGAGWASRILFC